MPVVYEGGGGSYTATSIAASVGMTIDEGEWGWKECTFVAYLVLLHVVLGFLLWQRCGPRWTCRRRSAACSTASQANFLPDVRGLTVEGLKCEAKKMGLKTHGLRAELENSVAMELLSRSGDQE